MKKSLFSISYAGFWGQDRLGLLEFIDKAADLGYEVRFIPQYKYTIIDDHVPFTRQGVPAVDIIDFDYPYWHTTQDTPDKVSAESLEAVGRTIEVWLEE